MLDKSPTRQAAGRGGRGPRGEGGYRKKGGGEKEVRGSVWLCGEWGRWELAVSDYINLKKGLQSRGDLNSEGHEDDGKDCHREKIATKARHGYMECGKNFEKA